MTITEARDAIWDAMHDQGVEIESVETDHIVITYGRNNVDDIARRVNSATQEVMRQGLRIQWAFDGIHGKRARFQVVQAEQPKYLPPVMPAESMGNLCKCGGVLQQTGPCEVCTSCGETTGCS